ncbi:HigA family addiction module antidote protein [bacterium]|nr:HigA family addiction module antidote protein [bacterium]
MMTKNIHSDIPIPPGEYLHEVLEELGLSQTELSQRMGRPLQMINEIIKGTKAITPETAIQLEMVVGVPAAIWTGLESECQLIKAKLMENQKMDKEKTLLQELPVKDLVQNKFIPEVTDIRKKIKTLRKYFGVASLTNIEQIASYQPAFRCSKARVPSPLALAAWLRAAEIKAKEVSTDDFDKSSLKRRLNEIKKMSRQAPKLFLPKLKQCLAQCGIALVLLPHFRKTYAHGASFFCQSKKAILLLSIRGKWTDIFWFSLFHELGHFILHDKRKTYIAFDRDGTEKLEKKADDFAAETLIKEDEYQEFVDNNKLTEDEIRQFAVKLGIAPGIVVGRLRHDGYWKMNN